MIFLLLIYLSSVHMYFAADYICDIVSSTGIINLSSDIRKICSLIDLDRGQICGHSYRKNQFYSCGEHGEVQRIDLSNAGISGEIFRVLN